ncbi:hypothetical protein EMCRGX_G021956 [Ephydatia muelleri]
MLSPILVPTLRQVDRLPVFLCIVNATLTVPGIFESPPLFRVSPAASGDDVTSSRWLKRVAALTRRTTYDVAART